MPSRATKYAASLGKKQGVACASSDQEQPEPSPARKINVTKPMLRVLADKKRYVWVKWSGGAETLRLVQVSTDGEKYKFRDEWKKRDVIIPFSDIRELRAPDVQASNSSISAADTDLVTKAIGYLRSGARKVSDLAEVMGVDQQTLLKALTAPGVKSSRGVSKNSFSDKKNPIFMYRPVKASNSSISAAAVTRGQPALPGADDLLVTFDKYKNPSADTEGFAKAASAAGFAVHISGGMKGYMVVMKGGTAVDKLGPLAKKFGVIAKPSPAASISANSRLSTQDAKGNDINEGDIVVISKAYGGGRGVVKSVNNGFVVVRIKGSDESYHSSDVTVRASISAAASDASGEQAKLEALQKQYIIGMTKAAENHDHATVALMAQKAADTAVKLRSMNKKASISAAANDTTSARYSFPDAKSAASFVQRVTTMGLKAGASGLVAAVVKPGMKAAVVSDAARSLGGKPTGTQDVSASNDPAIDAKIGARIKELSSRQTADLKDIYSRYHRVSDTRGVSKRDLISDILEAEYGRKKISAFFDTKKASISASNSEDWDHVSFIKEISYTDMKSGQNKVAYVVVDSISDTWPNFQKKHPKGSYKDARLTKTFPATPANLLAVKTKGEVIQLSAAAAPINGSPSGNVGYEFQSEQLASKFIDAIFRLGMKGVYSGKITVVKNPGPRAADVSDLARKFGGKPRLPRTPVAAASSSDRGYYVTIRPRPTDSLQSIGEGQKWTKAKAYEEAKRQSTKYHYARVIAPNHTIESEWSDGVNKG